MTDNTTLLDLTDSLGSLHEAQQWPEGPPSRTVPIDWRRAVPELDEPGHLFLIKCDITYECHVVV
jgi:hypothetical protein